MSDDLVKRLWRSDDASALTNEAARRIEALHVERDENEGVIKVWRRRCQEAEAERDAAVLAEREECARVAAAAGIRVYEANKKEFPSHAAEAFDFGEEVADAIRARSDKEPGK